MSVHAILTMMHLMSFKENYAQNIRDVFLANQPEESEESDDKIAESPSIF
jgi:hypothetical protein